MLTLSRLKSSTVDLLPSALLRSSNAVFALFLVHMSNLSFFRKLLLRTFEIAHILPLLNKPGLDKDKLRVCSTVWSGISEC